MSEVIGERERKSKKKKNKGIYCLGRMGGDEGDKEGWRERGKGGRCNGGELLFLEAMDWKARQRW